MKQCKKCQVNNNIAEAVLGEGINKDGLCAACAQDLEHQLQFIAFEDECEAERIAMMDAEAEAYYAKNVSYDESKWTPEIKEAFEVPAFETPATRPNLTEVVF